MIADLLPGLAWVVLFATLWLSISAAIRGRDPQRVDVVLFLFVLIAAPTIRQSIPESQAFRAVLIALLPALGLRLVGHFVRIPRLLIVAGWTPAPVALVVCLYWSGDVYAVNTVRLVVGIVLVPLAAAFAIEGRRSIGVKSRRLFAAALGTAFFGAALTFASLAYDPVVLSTSVELQTMRSLYALGTLSYFLAFSPPRLLTDRWRRSEQARYVARVNEREPEERGWLADEDLVNGASRCVGGSLALVARGRSGSRDLVIVASKDESLLGKTITPDRGLVGQAMRDGAAVLGHMADCEADLARHLAPHGALVLAAPIIAQAGSWGVVVAVHRRGALFPEDDLSVLAELARNAAIALDHAALIRERRGEARQAADRRIRELESSVSLMLDSIKDYAMVVLDGYGLVAAWHLGAEHVFGYPRQRISRQLGAALFDVPAAEFALWLERAAAVGVFAREGVCRRADGSTFTGETTIRPLVAEPGMPPGFVAITRDVTRQRNLEEQLHQGQKMQAIGQLAGGIAHDFNNLLTAILGYADWLGKELAGDRRYGHIKEIQNAGRRAADLTRQLLAFSRREIVQPAPVDVSQLIVDLLPMLRRLIDDRIEIVDATTPTAAPVMGDRSQLEQVLLNLVLNARDAMPQGGRITIRTAERTFEGDSREAGLHGRHVLLEVVDDGSGMDAETRRRAFEPFFTTKEAGRGTGLGLATVYAIVEQMKGLIDLHSDVGRGTTVRVYLPPAAEGMRPALPAAPASAVATDASTVLLVEDDDALRTYLAHVLETHGYGVIEAEGPEAALVVTESLEKPFQLVISDISLPGMSGPELVAELVDARPGLAALYISGRGEIALDRGRGGVPAPLLEKPFTSTDLLAKVREVLSVAR